VFSSPQIPWLCKEQSLQFSDLRATSRPDRR
jgi:hypothetical protein